jgi:hypothetical protein
MKRIFNPERKLIKLIKTERYLKSNYRIQKINDKYYVLKNINNDKYIDLSYLGFEWEFNHKYYRCCLTRGVNEIIEAFNYKIPETKIF